MQIAKKISKFIALEVNFFNTKVNWEPIFEISILYRDKGDHVGFYSYIAIKSIFFEFNIYDVRHECDYKKGK